MSVRRSVIEPLEARTLFSAAHDLHVEPDPIAVAAQGSNHGLRAQYFNKPTLTGADVRRIEDAVDFNWGNGAPHPKIADNAFSARFSGRVKPKFSERYTFHTDADQGVRLWVNGKLVIDAWNAAGAGETSGSIKLKAGKKYDLNLEYVGGGAGAGGNARLSLAWSSPSQKKQVIPTSRLFRGAKLQTPSTRVGVEATNAKASEPGSNTGVYTITRTGGSMSGPLDVRYVMKGSAEPGDDYRALDGVVTIPAGQSSVTVRLKPIDDLLVEKTESARLVLLGGDAYRVRSGQARASVRIADNDVITGPPPSVTIAATDDVAGEDNETIGVFVITRNGNLDGDLVVDLDVTGSAVDGLDYDDLPATVTIEDGDESATLSIRPRDDTAIEDDETVVLSIKSNAAYTVGAQGSATVTLVSDDVERSINFANAAASPIKRFEAPAVVIDDLVYVFGGWFWDDGAGILRASQRVDVYNPDTNTWTRKADLPTKLTHQGVIVDGRDIYMVGGFVGDDPGAATKQIWKYNVDDNDWDAAGFELPQARGSGGAALVGRRLHFFGGSKADRVTDANDHWSINLDNPAAGWRDEADLPNARHHFSTVVLNGQIYVVGGQHEHDGSKAQDATVHRYDPAADQWERLNDLPRPMSHAEPGTFLMNNRLVIGGGITTGEVNVDTILEYDDVLDEWREIDDLYQPLKAPVVQFVDGKLFVTGGEGNVGGTTASSRIGTIVTT